MCTIYIKRIAKSENQTRLDVKRSQRSTAKKLIQVYAAVPLIANKNRPISHQILAYRNNIKLKIKERPQGSKN